MNLKKLISNLLTAFGAQGVSFLCSVITTLLVPKLLGIDEFAYWQLFVFYTSYVSFFQLGLNDGVYLQHGGESAEEIDRRLIGSELRVGLGYQLVAALLIAVYAIFCESNGSRTIVLLASAVQLLLSNTTYFISYVFQAMNETKIASYTTIINRTFFLLGLCACLLMHIQDFFVYVLLYLMAQAVSLTFCLWKGCDFVFSRPLGLGKAVREALTSMRLGIVLTVANITGMLIMGIARLIIDGVWGLSTFGQVSLSLSIVNFALAFISQTAMVLFPALRFAGRDQERIYYQQLRDGLAALLPFAVLLYVPLRWLVGLWLSQYYDGLIYLAFLFPVCLFEIQTNLTVSTFLKVRCEPRKMLLINIAALVLALVAQCLAVFVFAEPGAVLLAAVFGVAMRYVIGTAYLGGVYESRNARVMICMITESIAFMFSAYQLDLFPSFVACLCILLFHLAFCQKEARLVLGKLTRLGRGL